MKKINYIILLCGTSAIALSSCNDNYETLPVNQFTDEYVFSTTDSAGTQATRFLNYTYEVIQNGTNRVGGDYLDAASDDAISINMNGEPDVLKLSLGTYTPSNRVTSDMRWGEYYTGIRRANIFIAGIDRVPFNTKYRDALGQYRPLNVSMKAEARFLRAYFYFLLLERYGGVPLLGDKVYSLDDNLQIPRNTFAQCVDYIVNELDAIKDSLRTIPIENSTAYAHVANKQACMALKARVLLYAASPLFNENPIEKGNELVGYASYDASRWKKAADAAREFISTYGDKGDKTFTLAPDARNVFLNFYSSSNPELIFYRSQGNGHKTEINNGPLGFSGNKMGYGRTNPTQNLVDAFPMKDGKPIGQSTKYVYDSQRPYDNRDPRLDITVLHNGSHWLGIALQTYQGGADNPSSAGDFSQTGYYMNKFMGMFSNATEYSDHTSLWVLLRYTEVLLNFAEAENESLSAPSQDVYNVIIQLRKRAGIDAGDDGMYGLDPEMTKEQMREVIHNERRLELAFEEHRYFDIRRWREAETIFARPLTGMHITQNTGAPIYTLIDVLNIKFDTRRYLYPIPYSEVIKNSNMIQNPNWK
mgnify:CR=1 FL=1